LVDELWCGSASVSVYIASSFCALPLSLHFYPRCILFFYCDTQLFSSLGRPSLSHSPFSLSPALVDSRGLSSIFLSYSPHKPNPSIPHPHSTFTARLRFDHLHPQWFLILYFIIYSQPPSSIIYLISSCFLLHSIVKPQNLFCVLHCLLI